MPSLTLDQKDELVASTFDKMTPDIINHTILDIPVYKALLDSPYRKTVTGGYRIRFPFIIDNNDSFGWFGMGDTFNPQRKDILAWGYATLKQGAGDYTMEWLESQINSGPDAFISLIDAKKQDLVQSVRQTLNTNAHNDGTGAGSKEPVGLTGNLPSTPTSGTYMGFARATEYWSRIWYFNGTTLANSTHGPHSLTAPQDNSPVAIAAIGDISDNYPLVQDYLQIMWDSIVTAGDDRSMMVHFTDFQTFHDYLKIPAYCPGYDIGVHEGNFNLGYDAAYFMGAPIIPDTRNNGAPSGEWRTVNKKYYVPYIDGSAFFEWTKPRSPYDALVSATYLLVRLQFVNTFPRKHGYMGGITTWQA